MRRTIDESNPAPPPQSRITGTAETLNETFIILPPAPAWRIGLLICRWVFVGVWASALACTWRDAIGFSVEFWSEMVWSRD